MNLGHTYDDFDDMNAKPKRHPIGRRRLAPPTRRWPPPAVDILAAGHLLQHLSVGRLLRPAAQLHARLLLLGVVPGNFLASKLLSLYSISGRLHLARRLFDRIPDKSTFSLNAMLFAYSHHGHHADAVCLFSSLAFSSPSLKPDRFTVTTLLKSLSSRPGFLAGPRRGKEVHSFLLRCGFEVDAYISNALIAFYARAGRLGLARKVFDVLPERDIVTWNSMICGYSQNGEWELCLSLYKRMREVLGLVPNAVTMVGVFQACAQLKDVGFGVEVHRYVVDAGIEMDVSLWNSIIGFYGKCGDLDHARRLFDGCSFRDEVSWNTMVSCYMSHGLVEKAMELFRGMASPNLSTWNAVLSGLAQHGRHIDVLKLFTKMQSEASFLPNSVTLASILPSLSYYSNLMGGKQVHCHAIRTDCADNIYVATAVIDMYGKCGFLEGAGRVFEGTNGRSVILWTAVIAAYAAHGEAGAALSFFDDMLMSGTQPDPITFTAVLSACAHAGLVTEAQRFFEIMLKDYGTLPSLEQYACIVATFSRAGILQKAVEFISRMPITPNAKVWGSLLNGASIFSDVDIGKYAFDKLVEIEPDNTGNYIIMANLYSKARKWEEAERVRKKMMGMGLSKLPGCSWVETIHGLQTFVASDISKSNHDDIYFILDGLVVLMREEGYASSVEFDEETAYG